jgi:D-alanyl-D-alanine carboxypeptidase
MTPAHRFHGASVTKMYTAAAVMLLVEDGLVDLDAPIRTYLPPEVWRPIPNGSQATVRQLLDHRSGIPDFSGNLAYDLDFLNDPKGDYPPERILAYLRGQSAWMAPGSGYFYSNANYVLLAMIADQVAGAGQGSGAGHADLIAHRILQPLGLTGTSYRNDESYPRPPGLVSSYQDLAGDGRLMNVSDLAVHAATVFFGNAGLIATSADFAAFLEGLMAGSIVSPETLALMMERPTPSSSYGLGLSFLETEYGDAVGHSGGDMGTLAQVRYFPDRDATLVLLSNGGDGGVPDRLFSELWQEAVAAALD